MPDIKLFYVRADNEDGENLDALVRAENLAEARKGWVDYYSCPPHLIQWVGEVPQPVSGPKGAIRWDHIHP